MHCDFSQFINIVTEFQILTKDSVTVAVDAVIYSKIFHPTMSVCNVEDASRSTRLLAATTLRNVLGTKNMSEILSDRDSISHQMQVSNYDFFFCHFRLVYIQLAVA
jgi:regulator of protease activity HflC (stomatin/prohibitin superfamily)